MEERCCSVCNSPLIYNDLTNKYECIYCGREVDVEYYEIGLRFLEKREEE